MFTFYVLAVIIHTECIYQRDTFNILKILRDYDTIVYDLGIKLEK